MQHGVLYVGSASFRASGLVLRGGLRKVAAKLPVRSSEV